MHKVLTLDQEMMMRNLTAFDVGLAKARAFAIYAGNDAMQLLGERFKKLNELFCQLDSELPEDSEIDVTQYDVYKAAVGSIMELFESLFASNVSASQHQNQVVLVDRLLESCI